MVDVERLQYAYLSTYNICLIYNKCGLVYLCINQNPKIDLSTTGPTHTFISTISIAVFEISPKKNCTYFIIEAPELYYRSTENVESP